MQAEKAPIQVFGVNGRYAHALFSAASKKKVLPQVEKELKEVKVRWRRGCSRVERKGVYRRQRLACVWFSRVSGLTFPPPLPSSTDAPC